MGIRCKYIAPHSRNKIIIDGSNNYLSLKGLYIREDLVKWPFLFDSLGIGAKAQHWEVVWIRPQRLHRVKTKKEKIIRLLYQRRYPEDWEFRFSQSKKVNRIPCEIWRDFKNTLVEMDRWFEEERAKFHERESYYDALQQAYSNIYIHKVGKLKVDPFRKKYGKEKGIDLAVAMKVSEAASDLHVGCITLISGDGDFVETVKEAKKKKPVYLVEYLGNGNKGASMSWELREAASEVISIHRKQLKGKFSVFSSPPKPSSTSIPNRKNRKRHSLPTNNSFKSMPTRKSRATA